VRSYGSYEEYVSHQRGKREKVSWLQEYDKKYSQVLAERLKAQSVVEAGMSVLCLGARIGSEVKAFLALGCFAVGIDLNPNKESKHVLYGDFHDVQFPSLSVDVVFMNCLDHVFSLEKVMGQVLRVLKPDGWFILEIERGTKEGGGAGEYESFYWDKIDDVVELLAGSGFQVVKRGDFDYPWKGQHIVFKVR